MFRPVFSFARKRADHTYPARVLHLDASIFKALVQFEPSGEELTVSLDPHDCSEALQSVLRDTTDVFRIHCDTDTRRCVQLHLLVCESRLDEAMERGGLAVEEHIVNLARLVWREARVPSCSTFPMSDDGPPPTPAAWRDEHALFDHQRKTVAWMGALERALPRTLPYAGNLRMSDTWYVDTEHECFTTDASWREAQLAGGVCADGTGTGKTAALLHHVASAPPCPSAYLQSRGTLVIVPLNLISQWLNEMRKFLRVEVRVLSLIQGRDVKQFTLQQLCDADVVLTTFHFLRTNKTYLELVDHALGSRPRSRPVLASWGRTPGRVEPVVEAVRWRRVVVDEFHDALDSLRDLRHLKLLQAGCIWGLTATPDLESEAAQQLYLLLAREKAHHPNLLAALIAHGVRSHSEAMVQDTTHSMQWVQLSAEEQTGLDRVSDTLADIVRHCTVGDAPGEQARRAKREALEIRVRAQERTVRAMEHVAAELERDLEEAAATQRNLAATRGACESHARDLVAARQLLDAESVKLQTMEASHRAVTERLASLKEELCGVCGERACNRLLRCCSTTVCAECAAVLAVCPSCDGAPLDVVKVRAVRGNNTKLSQIAELIVSLNEPVVLFVQWKSMLRGARGFFSTLGLRVLSLDGTVAQRASTLHDFLSGGVLLLCLEDSFAGLHLAHARHVIFAHAIVGDRTQVERLEKQAIARCVRNGQTDQVRVYSFVVVDSEEEHLWHRTHAAGGQ